MICKKCGKEIDKLFDEELCEHCHDIWLDSLLQNPNLEPILRLNRFAKDIGLGGN